MNMSSSKRLQKVLLVVWIVLCFLALIEFLSNNYSNGVFIGSTEGRTGFLLLMLALTFPSGFLLGIAISVAEKVFGYCCVFGALPSLTETILLWFGYVAMGYLQWFYVIPIVFKMLKRKKMKDG